MQEQKGLSVWLVILVPVAEYLLIGLAALGRWLYWLSSVDMEDYSPYPEWNFLSPTGSVFGDFMIFIPPVLVVILGIHIARKRQIISHFSRRLLIGTALGILTGGIASTIATDLYADQLHPEQFALCVLFLLSARWIGIPLFAACGFGLSVLFKRKAVM